MSKKSLIIKLSFSVAIIIIIVAFAFFSNKKTEKKEGYILKQYQNTIAIYKEGEETPYKILDVPFNSLPFLDREMLVNGIYADNLKEIMQKAEDYDG